MFNELYIRQNFRVRRFHFLHVNVFRHFADLGVEGVDIGETGQAKAEEGDDARKSDGICSDPDHCRVDVSC